MKERLIYTLRPDGASIWLPELIANSLKIKYGDRLTPELFGHAEIQGLIARRLQAEGGKRR